MNLFEYNANDAVENELVSIMYEDASVRIERIVSMGQITPEGFIYDQNEDEFVTVLKGEAVISLVDENRDFHLYEGDSFMIYAGVRHRVTYTSSPCIWLCVFNKNIKHDL